MSSLFKASLLLTVFFGINKIVALVRQTLIAKQFGFSPEIDAFNVANNIPDLLFSLITGGALAMAFIPILTEYFDQKGYKQAWRLFSIVSNIVFISTAALSIIVAIFADSLISSRFGIAPGFSPEQQILSAQLMRINLIATLIFSLSGLVMAGLQSSKHFLMPAVAPILYNAGQIFGAIFLVPYFGIFGLMYGVIIGAFLHLAVQIPALWYYKFSWSPALSFRDPGVRQTMRLMGPRILTVLCIQIMFLTRDNLASHLQQGSVTALTYAYFIMQVPETLIGTAIATALLPTLSELIAENKREHFSRLLHNSISVVIAITVVTTIFISVTLDFLLQPLFGFAAAANDVLIWTTRAYLAGLLAQCLLEITTRAFYARQNAKVPLLATLIRTALFIPLSIIIVGPMGAAGLALADSLAISLEVGILLFLLRKFLPDLREMKSTVNRTFAGITSSLAVIYLLVLIPPLSQSPFVLIPLTLGGLISLLFIRKELALLVKL